MYYDSRVCLSTHSVIKTKSWDYHSKTFKMILTPTIVTMLPINHNSNDMTSISFCKVRSLTQHNDIASWTIENKMPRYIAEVISS